MRLFHTDPGLTFWAGPGRFLAAHRGSVPVLLTGLYGSFQLRLARTPWLSCHAAIVPSSHWHELHFHGEPFSALWIEPPRGGLGTLRPLLAASEEVDGALIGVAPEKNLYRHLYEKGKGPSAAVAELTDLLRVTQQRLAGAALDPRIAQAIESLSGDERGLSTMIQSARRAALSPSRFQHLFTDQVGVPFRRYRAWQRLRRAKSEITNGGSVTSAAHAAGFFDTAHFAREHRATFGDRATFGVASSNGGSPL
jgi:AraC-like DNA-binding protein